MSDVWDSPKLGKAKINNWWFLECAVIIALLHSGWQIWFLRTQITQNSTNERFRCWLCSTICEFTADLKVASSERWTQTSCTPAPVFPKPRFLWCVLPLAQCLLPSVSPSLGSVSEKNPTVNLMSHQEQIQATHGVWLSQIPSIFASGTMGEIFPH